jgi:hypothetical protein
MVGLPVKRDLTVAYATTSIVAVILAVVSIAGLVYGNRLYPASQVTGNGGTDALNLACGIPLLLGSMWLARRGSLIGLLCWPGALFYVVYVYTFYIVGVPLNVLFLPYVFLVALSAYTTIGVVANIDGEAIQRRLSDRVPARVTGGMLLLVGLLFIVVDVVLVVSAIAGGGPVEPMTYASWVTDFVVQLPALLVVGLLLWRREALGYVAAPGLLLQGGVLNAGFAVVLVIQAIFARSSLSVPFVALVFLIGALSCFFLVLFVRAATSERTLSELPERAHLRQAS